MPYKNIAVVGAGGNGGLISKALLKEGANVVVLSRPASSSGKDLPKAIRIVLVDYSDVPALLATFKEHKIEVVISTISDQAISLQTAIGDAAKHAGVKLFLPSEFGANTNGHTDGALSPKHYFAEHLKSIGLPSARIFNGLLITYIPWVVGLESGKIHLVGGKGDQKATFTHPDDVAGFVAYILTHLPASELEDKVFRIEGESATMLQIAGYYGAKYPVEYVDEIPGEPF